MAAIISCSILSLLYSIHCGEEQFYHSFNFWYFCVVVRMVNSLRPNGLFLKTQHFIGGLAMPLIIIGICVIVHRNWNVIFSPPAMLELSEWQLLVQIVMKMLSDWQHFHFSVWKGMYFLVLKWIVSYIGPKASTMNYVRFIVSNIKQILITNPGPHFFPMQPVTRSFTLLAIGKTWLWTWLLSNMRSPQINVRAFLRILPKMYVCLWRQWLGAIRQQAMTSINVDHDLWCNAVSLGHSELKRIDSSYLHR